MKLDPKKLALAQEACLNMAESPEGDEAVSSEYEEAAAYLKELIDYAKKTNK